VRVEDVAKVVLAIEEHEVAEEVMHFLDRTGRVRVVATAADDRQLAEAVRQLEPDGVVASPSLLRGSAAGRAGAVLAVDTRESIGGLRTAVGAGARGFFVWPSERDGLASASARLRAAIVDRTTGGRVVAVHAARGGAGATFVASHLAASLARRRSETVLLDLDMPYGGLGSAVGLPDDIEVRALPDLTSVARDVGPADLVRGLWRHERGFAVAPASRDGTAAPAAQSEDVVAVLDGLAAASGFVVADVGRGCGPALHAILDVAHVVVLVLTLDVASFRATRWTVESMGLEDRCVFVVNRARRADVSPADVERVFGRPPAAVIPFDRGVAMAQDRGRLLPPRGRVHRAIERLTDRVTEER
jgi:pilus assembly protein CpaE